MKTFTIRNDFHNTEATVRVGDDGRLSKSQVRRVRRQLCGMADCKCGGPLSERGRQDVAIEYVNGQGDLAVYQLDASMR